MRSRERTKSVRLAASGLCLVLASATGVAQSVPATRPARPVTTAKSKRPGKVKRAYGIRWQPSLEAALAQAGKRQRPVVWFRVLGALTGYT